MTRSGHARLPLHHFFKRLLTLMIRLYNQKKPAACLGLPIRGKKQGYSYISDFLATVENSTTYN
ncbi:hypothetical protein HPL003_02275 [Paenibacillus terrae HPL-003]|uniref:Uncharacterized protein n=1 Tax=Paenibacillus terrae (strain HPL-003) TaxID=985665 RepID=G7VZJ4_PAETH|nr:hypothetical protein HPL003_02275 [Paenibacillus terrae HPL-003]